MSKEYRLSHPQQQQSTSDAVVHRVTDWNKCVLCQDITDESLHCPLTSKRGNAGAGYITLADNLQAFKQIDYLPSNIVARPQEDDLCKTFKINEAKWHDGCPFKFNKTKLERSEKRKTPLADNTGAPKTHQCSAQNSDKTDLCFCMGPATSTDLLHHASTFDLDAQVRKCALQLQDENLLAKLRTGDLIALEAKYHGRCLVSLYNHARQETEPEDEVQLTRV